MLHLEKPHIPKPSIHPPWLSLKLAQLILPFPLCSLLLHQARSLLLPYLGCVVLAPFSCPFIPDVTGPMPPWGLRTSALDKLSCTNVGIHPAHAGALFVFLSTDFEQNPTVRAILCKCREYPVESHRVTGWFYCGNRETCGHTWWFP